MNEIVMKKTGQHIGQPLITNLQRYSIHDGEGIRTTVFFKGCPLSCKWCHNPETQKYQKEIMLYQERCIECGSCKTVCPVKELQECVGCGVCIDECFHNARELCGTAWTVEALVKEVLKDRAFYETSGGGVTLSGGEVLAQNMDYIEKFIRILHSRGIRVNIDTCGAVSRESFERILPYVDTFLFDIKLLDEDRHRNYTGSSNKRILENLKFISAQNAAIWIRIPVIGSVNDTEEAIGNIGEFLDKERIGYRQIHLLPYHDTGKGKYEHLHMHYDGQEFYTPDSAKMEMLKEVLESYGLGPVYIGG